MNPDRRHHVGLIEHPAIGRNAGRQRLRLVEQLGDIGPVLAGEGHRFRRLIATLPVSGLPAMTNGAAFPPSARNRE